MTNSSPKLAFQPDALTELFELADEDTPNFVETLVADFNVKSLTMLKAMETALETSDVTRIELESHSLKSSSLTLGLELLGETCAKIEEAARDKTIDAVSIRQLETLRADGVSRLEKYLVSKRDAV